MVQLSALTVVCFSFLNRCTSDLHNGTMSFFQPCCGLPTQEPQRCTGDVALAPSSSPSSLLVANPSGLPSRVEWMNNNLRVDKDILRDCGCHGSKYMRLVQSGNIPEVAGIEVSLCPVEYDFSDLLRRHGDSIKYVGIQYVCYPNDYPYFQGAMLRLASSLKGLPHLSFLRIHGNARSLIPTDFLESLAQITTLQSLSLSGSFTFGILPLQCSSVEHLAIRGGELLRIRMCY